MKSYRFNGLFTENGWKTNTVVTIDGQGSLLKIQSSDSSDTEAVDGFALPAFQNAHSHAFQYAMAGLAEHHVPSDDFWSWREKMYELALTVDPDDLENIAAMLYAEMVRHGYSHVAEFHYLHHDKGGKPYANLAEHGERLIAAAQKAGIKITLVPMFYQKGGFGKEAQDRQRRFISKTLGDYWKLLEASRQAVEHYPGASLGFGVHSLRAVAPDDVIRCTDEGPKDLPFHIHLSEQKKEVSDALEYLKARPVQWLLNNTPVDHRFNLVHATHLVEEEIMGIARAGANVILCPSTEGNLGDGLFPFKEFQQSKGRWCIGTDGHVGLNPLEELRILDYGQRVTTNDRATFTDETQTDSGAAAFHQVLVNGRAAMGNFETTYFKEGHPFDAVVYHADRPLLQSSSFDNLLSTIIYHGDASDVLGTIINGEWKVKDQKHSNQDILRSFGATMRKLRVR